jgi:hypothetical protein
LKCVVTAAPNSLLVRISPTQSHTAGRPRLLDRTRATLAHAALDKCARASRRRHDGDERGFHCEVSGRGLVGSGFHPDHANQSVQGAPIPGRADSFVRAMVPSLSFGLRACRRDHT